MRTEDIAQLAREADAAHDAVPVTPFLERFAALVAAAEREACAKLVEEAYDYESFGLVAAAIRLRSRG